MLREKYKAILDPTIIGAELTKTEMTESIEIGMSFLTEERTIEN